MKANANTMIEDGELVLVPYREEHVADRQKYHEWMSNTELQELTASEPLLLEEEYEMQKKWQEDEDKLTFIICVRDAEADSSAPEGAGIRHRSLTMIGDVNLFFKGDRSDEDFEVEAEIMIAEPAYRRRGYASRALQLLFSYATSPDAPAPLPVVPDVLVVRIGEKNAGSIRLFEKLGFVITKRVEVFQEVEMRFRETSEGWRKGVVRAYTYDGELSL